ncbi:hypothetical protein GCM10022226_32240 [Sphaerisporangium flaviroseum]|uniref:Polyketide synthase n=1 Tax=Sphaerisporangium flaviroseum TaxID=509199 RepID=A0ABP7I6W1_9ACTN
MDLFGEDDIRRFLTERIAARCQVRRAEIDPDRPLEEFGLASRDAVAIAGELEHLLGRTLTATLVWEYPTINRLARGLTPESLPSGPGEQITAEDATTFAAGTESLPEPIAIVGLGCRLPGGIEGPAAFWRFLLDGGDAVGEVPDGRWDAFDDGSPKTADVLARTTRYGGFLGDIAGFDAEFFGIAPREAETMDPQQRILLETAWEALEHAGIAPISLRGSRTGAFVGISGNEYAYLTTADPAGVEAWTATGAALSIAANRLSYLLDLRGPSMSVDTACSSSLVAAHLAVRSLRTGETDLALAAGVNLLLSPFVTMAFDQAGGTAPDGRCKAFDASADGMVRAEGCGVVVLKRLGDAERDGDRVLAVIRETAVNQDGRSNGLVAPNPEAQERLLRTAYSGLDGGPDYVEAHGTGTLLGDPIEARALAASLCDGRSTPLLIGSVKSNLGHLEAAAGVTGLIKTVLALHHGVIPPSVHFEEPSPHIPWDHLEVATEPTPWPARARAARAGVSSFGFGGTNAHVVLEQHVPSGRPRQAPSDAEAPARQVFLLSDRSADRVREYAHRLADWVETSGLTPAEGETDLDLEHQPAVDGSGGAHHREEPARLAAMAETLRRRTGRGRSRAAVVATDRTHLTTALRAVGNGLAGGELGGSGVAGLAGGDLGGSGVAGLAGGDSGGSRAGGLPGGDLRGAWAATGVAADGMSGPVWVFSGYGSQWPGMGTSLAAGEPAFAAAVDRLEPLIRAEAGFSLREVLRDGATGVAVVQPMIFATQIALARLWAAYGVTPAAVVGHSMGEVAAAVVAGGLSLQDGVRVICRRASLLGTLQGGGAMAVLGLPASEVPPDLHVAVYSAPRQTVVTGDPRKVAELAAEVEARGLLSRMLTAEGAGHSPQVKPLLPKLRAALAEVAGGKPRIPFYSTVFDDPREVPTFEAPYWAAGVRRPVRLLGAVEAAAADGYAVFTEISPHPLLVSALSETLPPGTTITHSLRRSSDAEFYSNLTRTAVALPLSQERASPPGEVVDVPPPLGAERVSPPGEVVDVPLSLARERVSPEVVDVPLPAWRRERHWVAARRPSVAGRPLLGVHAEGPTGHLWTVTLDDLGDAPWGLEADDRLIGGLPVLPLVVVAGLARAAGQEVFGTVDLSEVTLDAMLPLPATVTTTLTPLDVDHARVEIHARNAAGSWIKYGGALVTGTDVTGVGAGAGTGCGLGRLAGLLRDAVRLDRLSADGTVGAITTRAAPPSAVPVPLAGKLVERAWHRAPLPPERGLGTALADGTPSRERGGVNSAPSRERIGADHAPSGERGAGACGWLIVAGEGDSRERLLSEGLVASGHWVARASFTDVGVWFAPSSLVIPAQRPAPEKPDGSQGRRGGVFEGVVLVVPRELDPAATERFLLTVSGIVRELAGTSSRLWLLTERAQAVREGERGDPGPASLRGLVRVLAFEHPALRATLVDVDDPARLVRELVAGAPDDEVAWRDGERYAARLVTVAPPGAGRTFPVADSSSVGRASAVADSPGAGGTPAVSGRSPAAGRARPVVRKGGGYLISGGYGGLGLVVARWLADRGAGRVVVSGRSGPTAESAAIISAIRDQGTEVEVVTGDLAMPGVAERLVDAVTTGGVRLRGVVHAAGTLNDRVVVDMGADDLHQVWSAKVHGGLRLHEATRDADLDWWVAFSSAASLLGSPGQGAYAAANAWLDALAGERRALGLPATTVNWGIWADVGGAGRAAMPAVHPITPAEGVEALEALLRWNRTATGVIRLDIGQAVAFFPEITRIPFFTALAGAPGPDPGWSLDAVLASRPEEALRLITDRLRERAAAVLGLGPSWPAAETVLAEAGMDSLAATRLRGVIDQDFAVVLPAAAVLRGGTLGDLAVTVAVRLGIEETKATVAEGPTDPVRTIEANEADQGIVRPSLHEVDRRTVRPLSAAARGGQTAGALFLAHPAGGTTEVYSLLVDLLGQDLPVYGLERLDDVGRLGAELGVPGRAARYVEAVRAVQPEGPYRLGGWSFGGILAFEIARQLGADQVEMVAMLDSGLPVRPPDAERREIQALRYADFARYLTETYGVQVALTYEELAGLDDAAQLALVEERVAGSGVLAELSPAILRHQITSHEDTRAIESYRPGTYEGRVVLYRTTEPTPWAVEDARYDHPTDPSRGFAPYSPGLEIVTIPGSHHLNLLDPPYIDLVAAHLGGLL